MPTLPTSSFPRGIVMSHITHITELKASPKLRELAKDGCEHISYYTDMKQDQTHYLREWRKFRKMKQGELAEAINTSISVISDLEREVLQLSPKWLRKLAPALETQPGHILDVNPLEMETDIIDLWGRIEQKDRQQAIKTLESFARDGTND